ncbi:cell division protein ZapE [Chitinimonas sp. BJB300]|uniref:cell division protein ZapE n=1 Tax=Chitinimonas sp. BJB300 TaxID=1559339 RepID=UPI000C0C7CA9|nr:cell division protein ZapE [Chitinimonas sp. BJB300]PHV10438.1 cell division protein ZapE [Chitinimonas sp. BJB300]TSJ83264.1 AFG1 family ATPase [Chitinimonas sp. BJB300]
MSQHVFTSHIQPGTPPQTWYDVATAQPGFHKDPAQAEAIEHLQRLYDELIVFKGKRDRLFGRSLLPMPDVPLGLYFWGGVGRGKSFLMDGFFACVPYRRKRRLHFHHFMQEVHEGLRSLKNEVDPLAKVAASIADNTRLLCFDEFHVSDIADAMILGRLFTHLFKHGLVLVATSNYAPDDLYPNGLQRQNFLPTIALLKQHVVVVNVDGGNDYRMRTLTQARTYITPITPETTTELQTVFDKLATAGDLPTDLLIEERPVSAIRHSHGVIWFSFEQLCDGPRSQTDYLWLARQYHTVILSDLPKLTAKESSAARRLTWLVDVFYDYRVKLIISAATPAEDIYTDGAFAGEFFRTASRLTEMQSTDYLALPHEAGKVKDAALSVALT